MAGDGICTPICDDLNSLPSPMLAVVPLQAPHNTTSCPIQCAPFIYPMLDWSTNPWLAVLVTLGGCVAVPACHAVWWGVYRGRMTIRMRNRVAERKEQKMNDIELQNTV